MKKIISFFILTLLVLQLTACNNQTVNNNEKKQTSKTVEQSVSEVEETEGDGLVTIQTKHFSVKVPKEWEEICSYVIEEMSITFTHKKSDEYFQKNYGYSGGYLFSLSIEDLSYFEDVEAEMLGGLGIPDIGEFNVWLLRACDIQTEGEPSAEYGKCCDEIENVISTLSFNEGYYFSKTPYKIEGNEYYTQNYEQPQIQQPQELQRNAINDTKLCSMAFDHFCRMAVDLRNELRNEGYRSVDAHAVYPPKVVSRTEQLVTIEGKINYWIGGGSPAGSFKATVVYDKYSGTVVIDNLN